MNKKTSVILFVAAFAVIITLLVMFSGPGKSGDHHHRVRMPRMRIH